jgi:hypothetical protein
VSAELHLIREFHANTVAMVNGMRALLERLAAM